MSKIVNPDKIGTIIDNQNKFFQIKISENKSITWRDSYRVFPVSLNDLCKTFNVEGKISNYDIKFNNLSLFVCKNQDLLEEFKKYSLQDSVSLLKALTKAQQIYYNNYEVDLVDALSTSSLSLKIFRKHFLDKNIPVLKGIQDDFIRKGYFGGATDYYSGKAEQVHYYCFFFLLRNSKKKQSIHCIHLQWSKQCLMK